MIQILIFDSTLVPGDIELVNVGVWTQAPELEIHLARVLAAAGDGGGGAYLAGEVDPASPGGAQQCAVVKGVRLQTLGHHSQTWVLHLAACVVVYPSSSLLNVTRISCYEIMI